MKQQATTKKNNHCLQVGIIGFGNLGSAVAKVIADNGHQVLVWEFDQAVVTELNEQHKNTRYLAGVTFAQNVSATSIIADVFKRADIVFVTLPSRFIESVLAEYANNADSAVALVNMSKGINAQSHETAFQTMQRLFPDNPLAMLAGPSIANEFARGVVTGVVAASSDNSVPLLIAQAMNNNSFAVAGYDDALGVELGGVLKNIYALGMGLFDKHSQNGLNFVGAYLTQALREMNDLGTAIGAKPESFYQLSGVGDLITTAMSDDSHNRSMGRLIAEGKSVEQVTEMMGVLPEGYNTLAVALTIAGQKNIQLPLAELLHQVINNNLSLDDFFIRFTALLALKKQGSLA